MDLFYFIIGYFIGLVIPIVIIWILWIKAKKNELYAVLCSGFIISWIYTIYLNRFNNLDNLDCIKNLLTYWVLSFIFYMITVEITRSAYSEGKEEFEKDCDDYILLSKKTNLTDQEKVRLDYLEKNKTKLENKYIYKTFRFQKFF